MRILSVDDNSENQYLIEALLRGSGYTVETAANGIEALERIKRGAFDLIISDILMPGMDGFEFCRTLKAHEQWRATPFIFYTATYTGPQDEAFALQMGASRFLQKPCEPELLLEVVRDTLSHAEGERQSSDGTAQTEEVFKLYNTRLIRNLEQKMLELKKEVAARQTAEDALRQSERKYRLLYGSIRDAILVSDVDKTVVDFNESFAELFGYSLEELVGKPSEVLFGIKKEYQLGSAMADAAAGRLPLATIQFRKKNSSIFQGETNVFFLHDEDGVRTGFISIIRDISEKIRLEKNRQTLESQFFQAQKMESVGRLAGGVAHDFNNMLTVILGVSGQALEQLSPQNPLYTDLQDIIAAGERSRDIPRQLLAFARKQAISPQLLHLNGTLEDMLKMLRRLIGEDVELSWLPGADLWPVSMDPSQLDQILANLCVNARDAMPGGGKIRIETRNTHLDDQFCGEHIGFLPGDYVELSVADTGCGMGDDVQTHLFEPFFTTKEVGRGTGLGLATVYGVVHQNHGFIDVKSKVDEGTLITIFLPRSTVSPTSVVSKDAGAMLAGQGETVLVVDDDPLILKVISRVLENLGYVALTAQSPTDAQAIAGRSSSPIDLLITDMVMPELNGSELARSLLARFPRLKCMFMSGYTTDVVSRMGDLGQDAAFLHKPFSNRELALKIREILDHNP